MTSVSANLQPDLQRVRAAVKAHFGFEQLRPLQVQAIECVLAGRDAVVVLPTGGGKSLCFQAPALVLPGVTLVVSPLISLMQDQVAGLLENGIAAAAFVSIPLIFACATSERRKCT